MSSNIDDRLTKKLGVDAQTNSSCVSDSEGKNYSGEASNSDND